MKTLEEMIAVMQAKLDGKPIERCYLYTHGNWVPSNNPSWNWEYFDYRVAVTKPSVDWSVLSKDVVAIATDADGTHWAYADVPTNDEESWIGDYLFRAEYIASFVPGTCDWRDSLIVRPEGV